MKISTIPDNLPDLKIIKSNITKEKSIKFLGILLDENLTWKPHIKMIENKASKNIGLRYLVGFKTLFKKCEKSIFTLSFKTNFSKILD